MKLIRTKQFEACFLKNMSHNYILFYNGFSLPIYQKHGYRLWRDRCWLPTESRGPSLGDGWALPTTFTDEVDSFPTAWGALPPRDLLVEELKCRVAVLGELKPESILTRVDPTLPGSRTLGKVTCATSWAGSELPRQKVPHRIRRWFQTCLNLVARCVTCIAP